MRNILLSPLRSSLVLAALTLLARPGRAQFAHPGCLSDQNDLDRMQAEVAAGAHPWIDAWNNLVASPLAQNTWTASPVADVVRGCSPTCTNNYTSIMRDAAAAYQNALRYAVSGDTSYADCAVNILNAWQYTLTTIDPCCSDHFLLAGIQGYQFACAAELLRSYPGWASSDFANFQNWMLTVWYPVNHDFLSNHNGSCISHYWCNWDACNMASMICIGVLCDNAAVFNEAVNYYESGAGNGALAQAIFYDFGPGQGQWQESGRDQGHTELGLGLEAYVCEVAWKQGVDLYGYADPATGKTLYDGMEYIAQYNVNPNNTVPYTPYNNCDNVNQTVISAGSRGVSTSRTYWDMLYNAFLRKGVSAPYTAQMAAALRPDHGGGFGSTSASWAFDHIGFSTLTHYLGDANPPAVPSGLSGAAGARQAVLSWTGASGATGYNVWRAAVSGGPYSVVANVTATQYTDPGLTTGTTYYYVVSGTNGAGQGATSAEVAVTSE